MNEMEFRKEAGELIDRARVVFSSEKFKYPWQCVLDDTQNILLCIKNDAATQNFSQKMSKLAHDFAFDNQGRPDIYTLQHSLSQLKAMLIPMITKHFTGVPIPRVEGSTPGYEFAIENLVFGASDILPQFFDIKASSRLKLEVPNLATDRAYTKIVLRMEHVKPIFRGLQFWYKRLKTPKLQDHGVATVDISGGTGINVKIVWILETPNDSNAPVAISLTDVKCNISRLKISIKDAKHMFLDRMATSMFSKRIKNAIAKAIVEAIVGIVQPLNNKLNELFQRRPLESLLDRANSKLKDVYISRKEGDLTSSTGSSMSNTSTGSSMSNTSTSQPMTGNVVDPYPTQTSNMGMDPYANVTEDPYANMTEFTVYDPNTLTGIEGNLICIEDTGDDFVDDRWNHAWVWNYRFDTTIPQNNFGIVDFNNSPAYGSTYSPSLNTGNTFSSGNTFGSGNAFSNTQPTFVPSPTVIEKPVYVEKPVIVEKEKIVEKPVYVQPQTTTTTTVTETIIQKEDRPGLLNKINNSYNQNTLNNNQNLPNPNAPNTFTNI
jgi:hypothetical protein